MISSCAKPIENPIFFRRAEERDTFLIHALIEDWAKKGVILPRKPDEIQQNLADFSVAESGTELLACGALAIYGPELAELRSIAVGPARQKEGLGKALVEHLIQRAKQKQVARLFVFTYVPGFFEKLGFRIVTPESLPQKAWKDCRFCPKQEHCDEIAMVRDLS